MSADGKLKRGSCVTRVSKAKKKKKPPWIRFAARALAARADSYEVTPTDVDDATPRRARQHAMLDVDQRVDPIPRPKKNCENCPPHRARLPSSTQTSRGHAGGAAPLILGLWRWGKGGRHSRTSSSLSSSTGLVPLVSRPTSARNSRSSATLRALRPAAVSGMLPMFRREILRHSPALSRKALLRSVHREGNLIEGFCSFLRCVPEGQFFFSRTIRHLSGYKTADVWENRKIEKFCNPSKS